MATIESIAFRSCIAHQDSNNNKLMGATFVVLVTRPNNRTELDGHVLNEWMRIRVQSQPDECLHCRRPHSSRTIGRTRFPSSALASEQQQNWPEQSGTLWDSLWPTTDRYRGVLFSLYIQNNTRQSVDLMVGREAPKSVGVTNSRARGRSMRLQSVLICQH